MLTGGLVGYMVTGVFVSVLYYPYFWYFTALMGALEIGIADYMMRLKTLSSTAEGESARTGEPSGITAAR
jgi:hypothetical protein